MGKIMEKRAFESHLGQLAIRIRSLRFREGLYLLAAAVLVGILVLVFADWRFQFAAQTRFALDIVAAGAFLWAGLRTLWNTLRRLRPDYLAVVAEGDSPAMENIMVNAVQFRELLAAEGSLQGVSQPMVEEEFRLADQLAETVNLATNIRREAVRRARRFFLVALVIAGIGFWLGKDPLLAIAPRYLDPWGDHPPYSKTRFILDPTFAQVDYGDSVEISVSAEGEQPRDVQLVIREEGKDWRQIPLFVQGKNAYRASIESVEDDFEFRARAYRARSYTGKIEVIKLPRIREVLVNYRYPAYTRLEPKTENLPSSGIKAVKRTEVTLEVGSNRPLKEGALELLSATGEHVSEIALDGMSEKWVRGTFSLIQSGSFTVSLVDVAGRPSEEPLVGDMNVLPDRKPEVNIVEPEIFSLATPNIEVPVEVEVQDDFGVTAIELFVTVDGDQHPLERLEMDPKAPDSFGAASFEIVPSEFGASPGGTIEFFARAWDNDPDGAKAGRSPVHTLRIISDEEYRQLLREMMTAEDLSSQYSEFVDELRSLYEKQKELRERTEELARKLDRPDLLKSERERLASEAEQLAKEESALAESAEALAERMRERAGEEPVLGVEEEFNELLESQAEELSRLAQEPMPEAAESLIEPASPESEAGAPADGQAGLPAPVQVSRSLEKQKEAEESLRRMAGQSEQEMAQVMQHLEDIMRVYADIVRLAQLYERQKQTTAETYPFREIQRADGEDLQGLRQISPEEEAVWRETVEVQKSLCEHAKAFLDDATLARVAPKIHALAEALDDLFIIPNTGLGALHMARGKGQAGSDRAKAARDGFELLFKGECGQCKGSGGCQSLCMALGQAMGTGGLPVPGMNMGMGMGVGTVGSSGMGTAGGMGATLNQLAMNMQGENPGAAASTMNIYGPETPTGTSQTTLTSSRKAEADKIAAEKPIDLATASHEVMEIEKRENVKYLPGGSERYAEKYKSLVEEYFRVLAEEGK